MNQRTFQDDRSRPPKPRLVAWLNNILQRGEPNYSHEQYRCKVVGARLRILAVLSATLAVLWIPVDWLMLNSSTGQTLSILRATFAAVSLALVFAQQLERFRFAQCRLWVFFFIQSLFFASMDLVAGASNASLLQMGYGLFPFAIVIQLAIFPLPLAAIIYCALPVLLALLVNAIAIDGAFNLKDARDLWLFFLVGGVAAWSSLNQFVQMNQLLDKREEAAHDFLTGLLNRRAAERMLENIHSRCIGTQNTFAMLSADIDHFKKINDQYGHQAGDQVLIQVAAFLRLGLRDYDFAARAGGEEFIIVLENCNLDLALSTAERIRHSVEQHEFKTDCGNLIRVTISIGVSMYREQDDIFLLKARSDEALYAAKHQGRNQVVYMRGDKDPISYPTDASFCQAMH